MTESVIQLLICWNSVIRLRNVPYSQSCTHSLKYLAALLDNLLRDCLNRLPLSIPQIEFSSASSLVVAYDVKQLISAGSWSGLVHNNTYNYQPFLTLQSDVVVLFYVWQTCWVI